MKGCIKNVTWMIVFILAAMPVEQTSYGMEKPDINNRLVIVNKSSWDIDVTNPEIGIIKSGDRYVLDKIPRQVTFRPDGSFLARFARSRTINIAERPALCRIENDRDIVLEIADYSLLKRKPWEISIKIQPRWKTIVSQAAIPLIEERSQASLKEREMFAVFKECPQNKDDLVNKTEELFKFDLRGFDLPFQFCIPRVAYRGKDSWGIQPYYIIAPVLHNYLNKQLGGGLLSELSSAKVNDDIINSIINSYKIHLMPKTRDIPRYYREIFEMIMSDESFRKGIFAFKVVILYPESAYKKSKGTPKIVIYVYGKENAQVVLNKIYEKFKNEPGSGQFPGFNEKVTDLIFFSQGNRQDKMLQEQNPGSLDVYEEPEKVYYSREKLEKAYEEVNIEEEDFHLINPADQVDFGAWQIGLGESKYEYRTFRDATKKPQYSVFGVFDGHRGEMSAYRVGFQEKKRVDLVAQNLVDYIHENVFSTVTFGSKVGYGSIGVLTVIEEAFQDMEERLKGKGMEGEFSATICFVDWIAAKILTANLGRSCAVISRNDKAIELSDIQISRGEAEQEWVRKESGRTRYGYDLGDITEPKITTYYIQKGDKFIILGNETLWKRLSPQEAVNIVRMVIQQNKSTQQAAQELVEKAKTAYHEATDIIAIVVKLNGESLLK